MMLIPYRENPAHLSLNYSSNKTHGLSYVGSYPAPHHLGHGFNLVPVSNQQNANGNKCRNSHNSNCYWATKSTRNYRPSFSGRRSRCSNSSSGNSNLGT